MEDPYRQGKPLDGLIAPDRRRQRAVLLVALGMLAGAVLFAGARSWIGGDGPSPTAHEPPPAESGNVALDDPPLVPTGSTSLDTAEIERVVAAHRAAVKRACWDTRHDQVQSARATMTLVVAPNGDVVSVESNGSDALLASCLEEQSRTWKFLAHAERSKPINIPFFFSRN